MEILHDFDLAVGRGQSLCLIGPNGAGKSTVLHSIFGFTNVFSGTVSVDGRDVTRLSPQERSEEHTSELQSLMRISYAVFCLKKKNKKYKDYNPCINIPAT